MHMSFLQAQVPDPKVITDYKMATFEFHTKNVHPADQMDMHRKTGEMVFSMLENASTTTAKLQVSLSNVQTQLKLEKISSFAKDNRIKTLEELVLNIGYDPSNVKVVEEILKKKKCRYSISEEIVETATNGRCTGKGASRDRRGKG